MQTGVYLQAGGLFFNSRAGHATTPPRQCDHICIKARWARALAWVLLSGAFAFRVPLFLCTVKHCFSRPEVCVPTFQGWRSCVPRLAFPRSMVGIPAFLRSKVGVLAFQGWRSRVPNFAFQSCFALLKLKRFLKN